MNKLIQYKWLKGVWMPFCLLLGFATSVLQSEAQEKPPRPIKVTVDIAQQLSFGPFIQAGNSGTVTVDFNGARTATGSIILPFISAIVTPALFIVDAEPGTLVTIQNGPDSNLSGGGYNINLKIGEASTGSSFIVGSQPTRVYVGGTLTIGPLSANPAGNYNGQFTVIFIQQ